MYDAFFIKIKYNSIRMPVLLIAIAIITFGCSKPSRNIDSFENTTEPSGESRFYLSDPTTTIETTRETFEVIDATPQSSTKLEMSSPLFTTQIPASEQTTTVPMITTTAEIPTVSSSPITQQSESITIIDDTKEQTSAAKSGTAKNVKQAVSNFIENNIKNSMSDYEKIKAAHDYIIILVDYDYENYTNNNVPESSHTAKGALINKRAVCSGYSYAFKEIMDALSIECNYITGVVTSNGYSQSHAWNIVRLNGEWYHIDCTWDDPIYNGKVTSGTENLSYQYFLIPDSVINNTHKPNNQKVKCTSTKYLYGPKKYNTPYSIVDSVNKIPDLYMDYYQKNQKTVTFYYPENKDLIDTGVFEQIQNALWGLGLKSIKYSYNLKTKCGDYYYTTFTFN